MSSARSRAVEVIDRTTFQARRTFSEAPASDELLRRTQPPGNQRLALVHELLASSLPEGEMPTSALELGVGHGELVLPMAELLPQIQWVAIEHPRRGYLARSDYRATMAAAGCRLVGASLTSPPLPFANGCFQLVTLSEVIEHLPSTAALPLLAEICRLLVPGGRLILTTPNLLALPHRLLLLSGRSPFDLPIETSFAPGTYGHIRLWSSSELAHLGRKAGLQVEQVHHRTWMLGHYCFDRQTLRWAERLLVILDRSLGAIRPTLRDSFAMVFRRPS